jgi:catechol 2,3-dioxygenase
MNPFFEHLEICEARLKVRDLASAITFYEKVVGFELREKSRLSCVLTPLGESSSRLVLIEHSAAPAQSIENAGLFHLAWLIPTRAAMAAVARRLVEHSVLSGTGDHGVSEALYFDDPDGNGLEIYADRNSKQWPRKADGTLAMYTRSVELRSLLATAAPGEHSRLPEGTRIGHLHLAVSDFERSSEFYRAILPELQLQDGSIPHAHFLGSDGYHHHLGLNSWRANAPHNPVALGLESFAFRSRKSAGKGSRHLDPDNIPFYINP